MRTLHFVGEDLRWLFETLVEACEVTKVEGKLPSISVNGRLYCDMSKVAQLLPDEPLQPHHQLVADEIFKKKQHGYRRTGYNIANRANSIASNARFREVLTSTYLIGPNQSTKKP